MKRLGAVLLVVLGCAAGATTDAYATETPPPTVSVDGLGSVPIAQFADSAEANAAYRAGLTAGIKDGLEKAEFLAAATGVKAGTIQQITERGSSIECVLPAPQGPEVDYESYEGAAPDSGSAEGETGARLETEAAPAVAPAAKHVTIKKKRKKKHHKPAAKKSDIAIRCTLSTEIVLTYSLTAPVPT